MAEVFLNITVVLFGMLIAFALAFIFVWASADRNNKFRGIIGVITGFFYSWHWIILAMQKMKFLKVLSEYLTYFTFIISRNFINKIYNLHFVVMDKPSLDYFWYSQNTVYSIKEYFLYNIFGAMSIGFIFFAGFCIYFFIKQGLKPKDVLDIEQYLAVQLDGKNEVNHQLQNKIY